MGGFPRRSRTFDARAIALVFGVLLALNTLAIAEPSRAAKNPLPLLSGPNVLIIVTDDQRATGTLGVMPETHRHFTAKGIKYENAFATIPLCCPSRASIFTGQYAHNHGVRYSHAAEKLDQASTMQRYLQQHGYHTGIFGKYLNSWDVSKGPPYFNDWAIFSRSNQTGYYGGEWNIDGVRERVDEYSTDYIADSATDFLDSSELIDVQPWFLYLATAAPHAPYVAEPKYANAPVEARTNRPNMREDRLQNKPRWVRDRTLPTSEATRIREGQLRTLMSVDELVRDVFEKMQELGETRDLLAFYLSDNGFMWGEHGLTGNRLGKRYPYTESVLIPFLVRGLPAGAADPTSIVGTIDVAPTVLEAAGIAPDPEYPIDGRSLVSGDERDRILLEYWHESNIPSWASIRTPTYQFVEYFSKEEGLLAREYYDLENDPLQLYNLLGDADPYNDPDVELLNQQLEQDRHCVGSTCP